MSASSSKKIIVTGGAGFIGSAFVWKCNQMGVDEVLIVDDLASTTKWKNLVGLRYVDYIHKDTFMEMLVHGKVSTDVRAVIHMGACSATTEMDVDYLMRNNYRYTRVLADWCVTHDIRFIYASSAATYGDGQQGFDDDESKLETLRPINAYGYSKHLFDLYAKRKGLLTNMVGLKFFNVFGPNEYHKGSMMSILCKSHATVKETGVMKLFKSYRDDYEDGGQMRDFVYVKDCIDMMWWLMENPTVNGIYNIGTGKAQTWNELATALFLALEMPVNIDYIEMPEGLNKQYQYYTQASMKKLIKAGYPVDPQPLNAAVSDYVVNYLNNTQYLDH